MKSKQLFHIGFLVENLEDAIASFSEQIGTPFTEPAVGISEDFSEDGLTRTIEVRYAYSKIGPPYCELIEVHDEGLYGRAQGLGVHHVGMWMPDCASRVSELRSSGIPIEAMFGSFDDYIRTAYFQPPDLPGLRIELMDERNRARMEAWIGSGYGDDA